MDDRARQELDDSIEDGKRTARNWVFARAADAIGALTGKTAELRAALEKEQKQRPILAMGLLDLAEKVSEHNFQAAPILPMVQVASVVKQFVDADVRTALLRPVDDEDPKRGYQFWATVGSPSICTDDLPETSLVGLCCKEREVIYVPDRNDLEKGFCYKRDKAQVYKPVSMPLVCWFVARRDDRHWRSLICVPITLVGRSIGAFCVDCEKSGAFPATRVVELQVCASLLAQLVIQERILSELKKANRELDQVYAENTRLRLAIQQLGDREGLDNRPQETDTQDRPTEVASNPVKLSDCVDPGPAADGPK